MYPFNIMTIIHKDEYFTDAGLEYVDKVIGHFEKYELDYFKFENNKTIMLDGDIMELDAFNLYINPIKDGFDVQLVTKKESSQSCYMFGIYFYPKDGVRNAHVYHHGHGPFKCYGFKYERDR